MINNIDVFQTDLPLRAKSVLRMNGIVTVADMLALGRHSLYERPGFGKGIRNSIDAYMVENGLKWLD